MVVKIINHLINRQLQQHYCYKLELLCQEEGNYVFSLPKLCKHSTPRASSTKFYFRYRNIYSIYLLTLYSFAYGIDIMNRMIIFLWNVPFHPLLKQVKNLRKSHHNALLMYNTLLRFDIMVASCYAGTILMEEMR